MALEARRQQRLEQAYIDLLSYLSHHQELAWSMGPLSEMSAPEPLSREERWRIEGLVTAYGSQEVRRLLEAWTRCLMKVQIANMASQLLEESQGLKPQLEEQAKQEQKAIPSYNEAVNRADAAIRERVRRELAGEV